MRASSVAAACLLAAAGKQALAEIGSDSAFRCPPGAERPRAPELPTDHNGIAWPDFCFEPRDIEEHFFIIGDWGGIFQGEHVLPIPAFDDKQGTRTFVHDVDDRAQLLVAAQMKERAAVSKPRYLLNVGDNFYWGGVDAECGAGGSVERSTIAQWNAVFEQVYDGPDLAGKPWMGVLGNHDYGGYKFTKGWDQAIAYTWGGSDRWLTPALYWSTKVKHSDFTVDYFFVDSNVNDAFPPGDLPNHNICSALNNDPGATCGASGPTSPSDCFHWFAELWEEQVTWMEQGMGASDSDWLVVVTHFPPQFQQDTWARLAETYGIDLFVTGHRHQQEMSPRDPYIGNAAWVVSGGGGGVTSEGLPRIDGDDDQYGFMDVAISKHQMKIESLSHTGIVRQTLVIEPRRKTTSSTSTQTSSSTTSSTSTGTSTVSSTTATTTKLAKDVQPSLRSTTPQATELTSSTRASSVFHPLSVLFLVTAPLLLVSLPSMP